MLPRCWSKTWRITFVSLSFKTVNSILHTVLSLCKLCDISTNASPPMWNYTCMQTGLATTSSGCTCPHSRGSTMNSLGTSDKSTSLHHSPFTMRRLETQALCQRTRTSRALIGRERSTVSGETRAGMCTCRGPRCRADAGKSTQHQIHAVPALATPSHAPFYPLAHQHQRSRIHASLYSLSHYRTAPVLC